MQYVTKYKYILLFSFSFHRLSFLVLTLQTAATRAFLSLIDDGEPKCFLPYSLAPTNISTDGRLRLIAFPGIDFLLLRLMPSSTVCLSFSLVC